MMYPYAQFLIEFYRRHGPLAHKNSPSNTKAAIIIENRPIYFLPMVIRNVMFFLGNQWNLYVVCGELSEKYVDDFVQNGDIHVIKLDGLVRLSRAERSQIMKTTQFWKVFREEKLLAFDTNSVMCGSGVGEFLDYDFIGAPIGSADQFFHLHGGFSLRSRRKMIECIVKGKDFGEAEDEFFTRMMRQIGAATPDYGSAARFAVASAYEGQPVGVTATDECLHTADVAEKIVAGIAP
jgi:Protein of unknown function (DUF5672)